MNRRKNTLKITAALMAACIFLMMLLPPLGLQAEEIGTPAAEIQDPLALTGGIRSRTEGLAEADAYEAGYTGSGLTHDRRFSSLTRKIGLDVSQWQGTIDWPKVAAAGVKFVIIRCGYTGMRDGVRYPDPQFVRNMRQAHAAGIKVGVYYFSQAVSVSEAELEASYAASMISKSGVKPDLPVFMDVEIVSATAKSRMIDARLSKEKETTICQSFCALLEKKGYRAGVYSSKSYLQSRMNIGTISSKYIVWLAHYTSKTDFSGQYTFWQHSSTGKVNGIKNRVDCDIWYDSGNFAMNGSAAASKNGWVTVNGYKYYYKNGTALKGWQTIGGDLYYFTKISGKMATLWRKVNGHTYYMGKNGKVRKGWHKIGGKTYYFSRKTGKMWTGQRTIDGKKYKFRKNGSLIK